MRAARSALFAILVCAQVAAALGQDAPAPEVPPSDPTRLGLIHLGPFYLTPRLRIGSIGLDTNVFYTSTNRRTDFIASGGPGLEIVLPIRSSVRLTTAGGVEYLYFLRTTSQRRLTGDGGARLERSGPRSTVGAGVSYRRSFSRPNFEVDARVAEEQRGANADARLAVGQRLGFETRASVARTTVDPGQFFFGADLEKNLTRDTYLFTAVTSYRLTPKSSVFIEGDHQRDRFPLAPLRDADWNRLGGGFMVSSTTLFSGRAAAGVRSFRPRRLADRDALGLYALADLTYHFGPRTHLGAAYTRDRQYSAFETTGPTPTIHVESIQMRLEKGLISRLDLRLTATLSRLRSDGEIVVERGPGQQTSAVRDDTAWQGTADLGYTFLSHLRVGVAATYTGRRSAFADFGLRGLLIGATVTYTP